MNSLISSMLMHSDWLWEFQNVFRKWQHILLFNVFKILFFHRAINCCLLYTCVIDRLVAVRDLTLSATTVGIKSTPAKTRRRPPCVEKWVLANIFTAQKTCRHMVRPFYGHCRIPTVVKTSCANPVMSPSGILIRKVNSMVRMPFAPKRYDKYLNTHRPSSP